MYFLMSMCIICLKSKSNLVIINMKTSKKLLYCTEKTDDFIPLISNQTKICKDCLDQLNAAFDFKKMCLNNIVQFKDYINQLEEACNQCAYTVVKVELTDLKHQEEVNNIDDIKLEENLETKTSLILEQNSNEQTGNVKEELLDEKLFESYDNNNFQKQYMNEEQPSSTEEILKACKTELEDQSKRVSNIKPDLIDPIHQNTLKSTGLQQSNVHKNVFVKKEFFDLPHLQTSDIHEQFSNKELEFLLHKEKILDDDWEEELENHTNKILDQQPKNSSHTCPTCGKYFKFNWLLKRHFLIHTGQKPYSCSICGKYFKFISQLKKHFLIHIGQKPYSCSICGKCFNSKSNLTQHLTSHCNERKLPCPTCGKKFKDDCSLNRHVFRIHNDNKPYLCSICGTRFMYNHMLERHILVHTGQQPHCCSACGQRFSIKSNLNRHILRYHKQTQSCSICGRSFRNEFELNKHKLTHGNCSISK